MPSELSPIESETALASRIDDIATELDGRLGACIATAAEDGDLQRHYNRHVAAQFPSASTIKVLVQYALYREYDDRLDALDQSVSLAEHNRVGGSGVARLFEEPLSLRSLARAMIAVSDNAATNQLIDRLGLASIAAAADELGLETTRLDRKMMETVGEDPTATHSEAPVNTISPRDGIELFAALLFDERLSEAAYDEQLEALLAQNTTWLFARYLPESTTIAHKPGWLPDAALDIGLFVPGTDGAVGEDRERLRTHAPVLFAVCCDQLSSNGVGADTIAAVGRAVHEWATARA